MRDVAWETIGEARLEIRIFALKSLEEGKFLDAHAHGRNQVHASLHDVCRRSTWDVHFEVTDHVVEGGALKVCL